MLRFWKETSKKPKPWRNSNRPSLQTLARMFQEIPNVLRQM
jgi:hypothetical protein